MALEFAHGAIRWLAADAATTTYTVNGLAFQPKALRFYWVGIDSAGTDAATEAVDLRRGVGFATSTSNRRSVASYSDDTAATSDCATVAADDCVVCTLDNTAARDGELDLNSITSDGFTLIVDDQGVADITVFWEAWGGSDITVAVCGDITEPASTGTANITATGLTSTGTDQVVMFAGVQSTSAINTATAESSGLCVGFATSTSVSEQVVVTGSADHNSAAMDTNGFCQSGKCLTQIVLAGGNALSSASITAWGTDLFTLTWAGTMVSGRKSIFLAIKGGKWQAGETTIAGDSGSSTTTVSGLNCAPIGVCVMGRMTAEQSGTTSSTNDRLSLGTGTSTSSRRAMGMLDEDATASSATEVNLCVEYDSILAYPSTAGAILTTHDLNAMNSDGFQLIVDTAGGVASEWIGYLAFGNLTAKTGSDSLAIALTESATAGEEVLAEKTASESLTAGLTEAAPVQSLLSVAESLAVTVSDADILAYELNLVESPAIHLTDDATLDTGAAIEKTGSESLPVGVSDDAVILATFSSSDSLAIGTTEAADVRITETVSDSLAIGATEDAGLTVAYAASDSLAVEVGESATLDQGTQSLTASDDLPVQLTETAVVQSYVAVADEFGVSLTETVTQVVTQAVSDDLAAALAESGVIATFVQADESWPVPVTESATQWVAQAVADEVAVLLTESTSINTGDLAQITASDSLSVVVAETDITAFELAVVDSLAVAVSDASTLSGNNNADALPIGWTESATIYSTGVATDSLRVDVVEPSAYENSIIPASDSVTVGLTESATASEVTSGTITSSESLPISLAESATVASSVMAGESLVVSLTESSIALVQETVSDDLRVHVAEDLLVYSIGTANDQPEVHLTENATVEDLTTGISSKTASDTPSVVVSESVFIASTDTASENLPMGLSESAVILAYVATTDSITVSVADASQAIQVTLQASDTLPQGFTEAAFEHLAESLADGLAVTIDEAVGIFASFAAQDDGAVILTEASTVEIVGGLVSKAASEALDVRISESGVVVSRQVGALSVLVATAEYLGETREVDYNGTRSATILNALPYTADVLAVQE